MKMCYVQHTTAMQATLLLHSSIYFISHGSSLKENCEHLRSLVENWTEETPVDCKGKLRHYKISHNFNKILHNYRLSHNLTTKCIQLDYKTHTQIHTHAHCREAFLSFLKQKIILLGAGNRL